YWHGDIFEGVADTTPPTVTTRDPAPGATGVSTGTNVTAVFSEAVAGVNGSSFTLEGPDANPVAATVSYESTSRTATLDPTAAMAGNTTYTARLTGRIEDDAGNPLAPLSWTFTTEAASTLNTLSGTITGNGGAALPGTYVHVFDD